jgi:hypothetical protein
MTFALTSPVTGGAQTGFTTPAAGIGVDTPPDINAKQWTVTSVSGMPSVDVNSVSKPFTITMWRPQVLKTVPQANVATGIITKVPINTYKIIVRKGASPAANQVPILAKITATIDVPAGTDSYEPEEIRAMVSLLVGALNQASAGIGDTLVSGVL